MIVRASDGLTLCSVEHFRSVEFIDGGDTVVARFAGADGKDVAVVMPIRAACAMAAALDSPRPSEPASKRRAEG